MARQKYLVFVPKSQLHAAFVGKEDLEVSDRCKVVGTGLLKKDAQKLAMDIRRGRTVIDSEY